MEGDEQSFIFHTVVAVLLIGQIQFGDRNLESYITNPDILNKGKDDVWSNRKFTLTISIFSK